MNKHQINEKEDLEVEKKEIITHESIREKALKLIPEDFDEEQLKGILEIVHKLGNLSPQEREELIEGVETMTPEEIKTRLEKGNVTREDEKK